MPHRGILTTAERDSLLAMPDAKDVLIRHYTSHLVICLPSWAILSQRLPGDSGHNPVNTVYLERVTNALRGHGQPVDALLQ
jgi:hypothetical protein